MIKTYTGPAAPLTSLAISSNGQTLYGGSWDKTIWSWNIETGKTALRFNGHSDFVKTVLCLRLGERDVILSGGADGLIIIWDAAMAAKQHVLKGHGRGVLALAVDPYSWLDARGEPGGAVNLFSASSDPHIRRWSVRTDLSDVDEIDSDKPILQHETSVNALHFDEDGDLWTASSDGSAKCLSRELKWQADVDLPHGDYVRDVVIDERGGWVATVGRDEEVKVWNRSGGKLYHTYSGHYEEITGCLLLEQQTLVTVGIDCTLRRWSLKAVDIKAAQQEAEERQRNPLPPQPESKQSILTAEEERELAELMEDD